MWKRILTLEHSLCLISYLGNSLLVNSGEIEQFMFDEELNINKKLKILKK